jgi:hypothetical protein
MQMQPRKRFASIEWAFRDALWRVLVVIDELSDRRTMTCTIDHLRTAIAALPLSSDERSGALQRIRNTRRFLAADEKGAAVYELRALLQGLAGQA